MSTGTHAPQRSGFIAKVSLTAALLLAASLSLLAQNARSTRIRPIANGVEVTANSSSLDVTIVEDNVVRLYARAEGASSPRTLVLDPSYRTPSSVSISRQSDGYVIRSAGVTVRVHAGAHCDVSISDREGHRILEAEDVLRRAGNRELLAAHASTDTFYGLHGIGLHDTTAGLTHNTGGPVRAGIQGESGGPFVFTKRYGLLVDSEVGDFRITPTNLVFEGDSRPDLEAFIAVGPPLTTMANLSRLVGPPPLPPKWTLGFLNSQWGSTQQEVENIVATYRKRQIPIDGFILDFDWKAWGEDNYGEWRWNSTSGPGNVAPDKFPDGASGVFAKRMRQEGVKLAGILKPRILLTVANSTTQATMAAAYATEHHLWYPGEPPMPDYFSGRMAKDLDFNSPQTRDWYWQHLLPAFHAGMVGWWNDEADISGTTVFNNFQFLNMGRMLYTGQRADSNLRVWSINRAFFLGASRYGYAGWSGDIKTGFPTMAFQRIRMLAALDTGEFHWSMDTGGFNGHPTPENYARWMEFAAFVPIMRVHGDLHEKRQPWVYGPVAEAAAKNAIDLRYSLLPYIYSYERQGTEGNVGLVRPLFWQFPEDKKAAAQTSEWMFGDGLLVSPVVTKGATEQTVYLPAGEWMNYATGQRYRGHQTIQVPVDASTWKDIPLFVRSGSILATQPVEQYVGQQAIRQITLDIFPDASAAHFLIYDDDGTTYAYEKGQYLRQPMSAVRRGATTTVTLDDTTGQYATTLTSYLLRIHTTARSVQVNGKTLPRQQASAMPAVNAWSTTHDRFGPVVLVRVRAGGPHSTLTLR
jgi:alpha-glucosidase